MRGRYFFIVAVALAILVFSSARLASAQEGSSADRVRKLAAKRADLKFSSDDQKLVIFSSLSNAVFVPDGVGPFPAIILVHTCRGVDEQSKYWAAEFLKNGYIILVIDSFGPRDLRTNCVGNVGNRRRITVVRGVKDAFDTLRHLHSNLWSSGGLGLWECHGEVPLGTGQAASSGPTPFQEVRGLEPS